MSTGMQPRGDSPRGLTYVKVLKPRKILNRFCNAGDVIMIEAPRSYPPKIMPAEDGLSDRHAEYLVGLGIVKTHQLQPGDRPISVRPKPLEIEGEPKIEAAVMTQQRSAEKAVTGRQKAAI